MVPCTLTYTQIGFKAHDSNEKNRTLAGLHTYSQPFQWQTGQKAHALAVTGSG